MRREYGMMHADSRGVGATPTRGVQTTTIGKAKVEASTNSRESTQANEERKARDTRRARIEEVDDEGDVPAKLRTEIYMRPEVAWPLTCTNSLGARAAPVREVDPIPCDKSIPADNPNVEVHLTKPEDRTQLEIEVTEEETWTDNTEPQERTKTVGVSATPARGVESMSCQKKLSTNHPDAEPFDVDAGKQKSREDEIVSEAPADGTAECAHAISAGASATPVRGVLAETVFLAENATDIAKEAAEYEDVYDPDAYATNSTEAIYTRATDLYKPERVKRVVEAVQIGPDLTDEQRTEVRAFVAEYADIFALAVSEVSPVAGAVYAPNIP
jgi:hypothetical protein